MLQDRLIFNPICKDPHPCPYCGHDNSMFTKDPITTKKENAKRQDIYMDQIDAYHALSKRERDRN